LQAKSASSRSLFTISAGLSVACDFLTPLAKLLVGILLNWCHFCFPAAVCRYERAIAAVDVSVATMVWCEKHHWTLFAIIHDKALPIPVTINVMYQVFSLYEDVEKIVRF